MSVIPDLHPDRSFILTGEKEDYTVPRSHESFATKPHSAEGKMKKKSSRGKPSADPAPTDPNGYLRYFEQVKDDIVETTQRLVEIESPSDLKQAVDRVGTVIAGRFDAIGGKVTFYPAEKFGNHLQVDFEGWSQNKPVLLLGHMDTVYHIGTQ